MRQLKIQKQITLRDSDTFSRYLTEVNSIPMISPEKELELARKIKQGDLNALEELVRANLRFVISVAKQYNNQGLNLQDLINEGNLGLIRAAEKFDDTRGFKFISYAVWWIRQSIMQALAESGRQIRIPLNKVAMLNKVRKARVQLEQVLQREPTIEEMVHFLEEEEKDKPKRIGFSKEKVEQIINSSNKLTSLDAPIGHESETSSIIDLIPGEIGSGVDGAILRNDLQIELKRVIDLLSEKEKNILIFYYGLFGKKQLGLEEIGNYFGLTRERVRQIKEMAIKKIRRKAGRTRLIEYF